MVRDHAEGLGRDTMTKCDFCGDAAQFVAAQSESAGKNSVTWRLICVYHRDGWNDGGDWIAPIYILGKRVEG